MTIDTRTRMTYAACGIALALMLGIAWLSIPRHGAAPKRDQDTLDSLRFTQPTFHAVHDTLIFRETTYVRRVDTLVKYADRLDAVATVLHRSADSLASLARRSQDTLTFWRMAYDARSRESDTLRKALFVTRDALETQRLATTTADSRADMAMQRLMVSENLNARLATDITRATECKWLWMRCPSRGVMLVGGVLVGAGATLAVSQLRP